MHDHQDDEDEKLFAAIQHAAANLPPRPRGKKAGKDTFVKVPLWWFERVAHAVQSPQQAFVAVWLLHLSWKAKSKTFPVPNGQLEQYGVERRSKRQALACLEAAGLITVERRDRKTPWITLVAV